MYLIQQWNHPYFIYLLIPLTIVMLCCVYSYFWMRFRPVVVERKLKGKKSEIDLAPFMYRAVIFGGIVLILSTGFLIMLPKSMPFAAFILSFLLSSVLCVCYLLYLNNHIKNAHVIPENTEANVERWKGGSSARAWIVRPAFLILSMALMILALMGPEGGEKVMMLRRTPMNVTILLDLSKSMDAQDYRPSRLSVVKDEIVRILDQGGGDEIGLVYFTDVAAIQAPQTLDSRNLRAFVEHVGTDSMPTHGTDLGKGLEAALRTFDESRDGESLDAGRATRRVVLVTDGETHAGDIDVVIDVYKKRRIHIDVIAIGSENGSEIPDGSGGVVKYQDKPVVTKVQTDLLSKIAADTDGTYVRYTIPELASQSIISNWNLIRVSAKPRGLASSLYREQLYPYFSHPSYLLFLLYIIYPLLAWLLRPVFACLKRRCDGCHVKKRTSSQNTENVT